MVTALAWRPAFRHRWSPNGPPEPVELRPRGREAAPAEVIVHVVGEIDICTAPAPRWARRSQPSGRKAAPPASTTSPAPASTTPRPRAAAKPGPGGPLDGPPGPGEDETASRLDGDEICASHGASTRQRVTGRAR